MKKCKLCGRAMPPSTKVAVCRSCRQKIGEFAKKSIAGTAVVAGAAVAAGTVKKKGAEGIEEIGEKLKSIKTAEGVEKAKKAGMHILEEGRETANLAGSFIEEHTMGARDLVERGIEAAELRLKGLPAAYAREEHPFVLKKLKDRYAKWLDDTDEPESEAFQEPEEPQEIEIVDEEVLKRMLEED